MKKQKRAIKFAVWVQENMYELTYQDIENDGSVWTCCTDTENGFSYNTDTRYTIEEIYDIYLDDR